MEPAVKTKHLARAARLLGILVLATGSLAGLSIPGAAAASAAPSAGLQLRLVGFSPLPAALRGRLGSGRMTADAAGIAEVELINEDGNYCLDANDSGSTAGKNGDKVQLWKCTGNANQFWSPGAQDSAGFETLFNDEYQSECLNANDLPSLGDGSKVQLWGCGGEANDMWDVTNWADCVEGLGGYCSLCLQSDGCVYNLDAQSQHIGEGDQVQIFTLNGGKNQLWKSQPVGL
jgi:hypothetical protein